MVYGKFMNHLTSMLNEKFFFDVQVTVHRDKFL